MSEQPLVEISPPDKIPDVLPILPLFDTVLFPKMVLPIIVAQKESIQLMDEAMAKDRIIGMLVSKNANPGSPVAAKDLYGVGTSALILKMAKMDDNKAQMLVQGLDKFKIQAFTGKKPYLQARIDHVQDEKLNIDKEVEAFTTNIGSLFTRLVELSPGLPPELSAMAKTIPDAGDLANMVASLIPAKFDEKQTVLEMNDVRKRLKEVTRLVN
ncbi:MAG: LON peptidase substrate-binding domain-containing protein, partial [Desulfobacterales bacterium]